MKSISILKSNEKWKMRILILILKSNKIKPFWNPIQF